MVFVKKSFNKNYPVSIPFFSSQNDIISDTVLHYENPPTLNLKYPLTNNLQWTYRKPTETRRLQIDKKVVDIMSVKTEAGSFNCFKIEWIYLNDTVFTGFDITDYISTEGLIKRECIFDRITFTTAEGEPIYGQNAQITEIIAWAHLKEFPDYYTRLEKLEKEAEEFWNNV